MWKQSAWYSGWRSCHAHASPPCSTHSWDVIWSSVPTAASVFSASRSGGARLQRHQVINHFPTHYELTRKGAQGEGAAARRRARRRQTQTSWPRTGSGTCGSATSTGGPCRTSCPPPSTSPATTACGTPPPASTRVRPPLAPCTRSGSALHAPPSPFSRRLDLDREARGKGARAWHLPGGRRQCWEAEGADSTAARDAGWRRRQRPGTGGRSGTQARLRRGDFLIGGQQAGQHVHRQ